MCDSEEEGGPAGGCFVKRVSQQPHKKHLLHAARKGKEQKLNVQSLPADACMQGSRGENRAESLGLSLSLSSKLER